MVLGLMIVGSAVAGGVVIGHYATRSRYESMSSRQVQQQDEQATLDRAEARAAQPEAQASQGGQVRRPHEGKKDFIQQLEELGRLKRQGVLTEEEEFQKMKTRLLLSD